MYDIAIIGSGPAGLSAAINAKIRNKDVVVFGRDKSTSWLYNAENVNNHLGAPNMSGRELIETFYAHAKELDVLIKDGRVLQILSMGEYFMLNVENEFVEAKSVIIATGIAKSKGFKGEQEFLGKGLSYCATCDGMLYRGKEVVIYSEIEEGIHDANFLAEICSKVTFVSNDKKDKSDKSGLSDKIIQIQGKIEEISGEKFVDTVVVNGAEIPCSGVFVIKDSMPISNLIFGLELDKNAIAVNRLMETNISGVFAAGDITGWPFQVSNAIGDGLVAAQSSVRYVDAKTKAK